MPSSGRDVGDDLPLFSQEQIARFSEFLTGEPERDQRSFRTLIATVSEVLGETDLDSLLRRLLDRIVQATGSERGILLLHEGGELRVRLARDQQGRDLGSGPAISRSVPESVFREGKPIVARVGDGGDVLDITRSVMAMRLRSVMCAPLSVRGRTLGAVYVDSTLRGPSPSPAELMLFHTQAGLAAMAIENHRLVHEALEARAMEDQLRVARGIQRRLLPEVPLRHAGMEIEGTSVTFERVGGDYFDYFPLGGERAGFAVADVSGHGIGPALIMSNVRAHLRSILETRRSLNGLYGLLNRALCRDLTHGMFVSLFVGLYDRSTGILEYQNAGHCPPMILRRSTGDIIELGASGPALGILDDVSTGPCAARSIQAGDVLLCYTDGATEAHSPSGEIFGEERLRSVFAGAVRESPAPRALLDRVHESIRAFAAGHPPADDLTLLAARW